MIKKALNRLQGVSNHRNDGEKVAMLLNSAYFEQLMAEQDKKTIEGRTYHAEEIKKIEGDVLQRSPEIEAQIKVAENRVTAAYLEFQERQFELRQLQGEYDSLHARASYKIGVHRGELTKTAPAIIEDFLIELYKYASETKQVPRSSTVSVKNMHYGREEILDVFDALKWRNSISEALRSAELLKLEPDYTNVIEKIDSLRALIFDPKNLPFERVVFRNGVKFEEPK